MKRLVRKECPGCDVHLAISLKYNPIRKVLVMKRLQDKNSLRLDLDVKVLVFGWRKSLDNFC